MTSQEISQVIHQYLQTKKDYNVFGGKACEYWTRHINDDICKSEDYDIFYYNDKKNYKKFIYELYDILQKRFPYLKFTLDKIHFTTHRNTRCYRIKCHHVIEYSVCDVLWTPFYRHTSKKIEGINVLGLSELIQEYKNTLRDKPDDYKTEKRKKRLRYLESLLE